jgi:hypothetical protein
MIDIYLWLTLEKYKIASWKKKECEDLKDLLVLFRLYFIIVEDWLCISTIFYLFINICDIDCKKNDSSFQVESPLAHCIMQVYQIK